MEKHSAGRFRIMLIGSSGISRRRIAELLSENDNTEAVTEASDIREAEKKLSGSNAAVIELSCADCADRESVGFIKKLAERNIPCIVLTPENSCGQISVPYAADILKKPKELAEYGTFCTILITKLILSAGASAGLAGKTERPAYPLNTGGIRGKILPVPPSMTDTAGLDKRAKEGFVVALGASTGGTDALECVLTALPETMPPILVVQHMPPGFTKLYSDRLDKCCSLKVKEACDGDRPAQGLCLIAAGGSQMELKKDSAGYYVKCASSEKVSGHCPSVDVLFSSVAETSGRRSIAALMTGMGSDGARGLLRMRDIGAYTIGQDRESCAVYGMPMEACKLGACSEQQPLENIGRILCRRLTDGW